MARLYRPSSIQRRSSRSCASSPSGSSSQLAPQRVISEHHAGIERLAILKGDVGTQPYHECPPVILPAESLARRGPMLESGMISSRRAQTFAIAMKLSKIPGGWDRAPWDRRRARCAGSTPPPPPWPSVPRGSTDNYGRSDEMLYRAAL